MTKVQRQVFEFLQGKAAEHQAKSDQASALSKEVSDAVGWDEECDGIAMSKLSEIFGESN